MNQNDKETLDARMRFTTTFELHPAPAGTRAHTIQQALTNLKKMSFKYAGIVSHSDSDTIKVIMHCSERAGLIAFWSEISKEGHHFAIDIKTLKTTMKPIVTFPKPSLKIIDDWNKIYRDENTGDMINIISDDDDTSCSKEYSYNIDDEVALQSKMEREKYKTMRQEIRQVCKDAEEALRETCQDLSLDEDDIEDIFDDFIWSVEEAPSSYLKEIMEKNKQLQDDDLAKSGK